MLADTADPTRNPRAHHPAAAESAAKNSNAISARKAAPAPVGRVSPEPRPRRTPFGLSLTQISGSTGAAVTAAFLGSRLGVAGTLVGAALASVISVVASALYTQSLAVTRQGVRKVIVAVRPLGADDLGPPPRIPPGLIRPVPGPDRDRAPAARRAGSGARRPLWRGVLLGAVAAAAVFASSLVVVTGLESVTGQAISGGGPGSLSVLGGNRSGSGPATVTVTATTTDSAPAPATAPSSKVGKTTSATSGSSTGTAATSPAPSTASATTGPATTGATGPATATVTATVTSTVTASTAATAPAAVGQSGASASAPSSSGLATAGPTAP